MLSMAFCVPYSFIHHNILGLSFDKLLVADHGGEIVTAHRHDDAVGVDRAIPETELDIVVGFIGTQTLEISN